MHPILLALAGTAVGLVSFHLLGRAAATRSRGHDEEPVHPIAFWARPPNTTPKAVVGEVALWAVDEAPDTFADTIADARCRFPLLEGNTTLGSDPRCDVFVPIESAEIPPVALTIEAADPVSAHVLCGDDPSAVAIEGNLAAGATRLRAETTLVVSGALLVAVLLYRARCRYCDRRDRGRPQPVLSLLLEHVPRGRRAGEYRGSGELTTPGRLPATRSPRCASAGLAVGTIPPWRGSNRALR